MEFESTSGDGCSSSVVADPGVQYALGVNDIDLGSSFERKNVIIHHANALDCYEGWSRPVVIVSDGAYGIGGFACDPSTPEGLVEWYQPHVEAWSEAATPLTTLWFWNTEIGWATVHPLLAANGWSYRCSHVWDKGIAHVAGNSNTQRLRKLPVVTEVCVQYVKKAVFEVDGHNLSMKEWLRSEWQRAGLRLCQTNKACGVRNAASRKYFTQDHLWYFPPADAFIQFAEYANTHGKPEGRPYFSVDGIRTLSKSEWELMRAKFNCPLGVTNVWREPAVRGRERIRHDGKILHTNQKPLRLIERVIKLSSNRGDNVWEPFGGLCSAAVASVRLDRACNAAETDRDFFESAARRLRAHASKDAFRAKAGVPA